MAGAAAHNVNVTAGGSVLVQVEAILKATSKMLTSISCLLMKMKRSMILKTLFSRMKGWMKLPLSPKPREREKQGSIGVS